jgi:hypothetical protein
MTMIRSILLTTALALGMNALADEFLGPFPSWANVKTEFGAVGDGKTDDTAAIQKALEQIRLIGSPKKVLYFPAGTYRITGTLRLDRISHNEPLGMSITGEDPETTVIRWDGPAGGNMFLYDAWYASLSRLTFDGAGKAKTAIEHGPAFATGNECTDVIIKDVQFGIEAGQKFGIAETAVLRCRFYRCAKAAISIQNFNSLDWYIWDCWFEDCGIGASNEFGSGNFHVLNSVFLRSKDADLTIRHTGYFSFAGNTSIGSRRFFHAKRAGNWNDTETWGALTTIQDNLILDPQDATPIVIESNGPTLIVDNQIRLKGAGPVVVNEPPAGEADLIAVGNRWTATDALRVKGRVTAQDDTVVKPSAIKDVAPQPVPFAARANRPVIEVKSGADAATIQAAIDEAVKLKGQRPVVHLPVGKYVLATTLVIPAGSDVQLVGDGPENATMISGSADALVHLPGPSRATLRNLVLNAAGTAVAVRVTNCDQPGGRIFAEQLNVNGHEFGLVADGLKRARVELRDAGHNGMQVTGAGAGAPPWVALHCGASARHKHHAPGIPLYDVQNGGRLFVRDIWYEGEAWSMLNLTGRGEFAYHSGLLAPYPAFEPTRAPAGWEEDVRKTLAPIEINGFRGQVSLTQLQVNGAHLRIKPPSPDVKLWMPGFFTNAKLDLGGDAVKGQVVMQHARRVRDNATGTDTIPDSGKPSPAFLREMLKPLREVRPQPLTTVKDGATDLRLHRVWANGKNGVRIQGAR